MNVILDTGAFVALEKADRRVAAMLRVLQRQRVPLLTSAAALAQVWRDGRKQAALAKFLGGVSVRGLTPDDGKRTGELMSVARTRDVVDAHVALLVADDDRLLTSDPDDLRQLLEARRTTATIVRA